MILGEPSPRIRHRLESLFVGQQFDRSSTMAATSPTAKSPAVTPSSISSGTPPTRVAMVGTLQAMASSAARPKDSSSLGMSIRSATGNNSCTRSCLPRNWTRFEDPCC